MKRGIGLILLVTLFAFLMRFPLQQATPTAKPPAGGYVIFVDVSEKKLYLYQNGTLLKAYPVATGAQDTPTPLGVFTVNSRFAGQMSGFGTRFLGLNVAWGQYGIHGTNKPGTIGYNASHGCIRMQVKAAEELYSLVPDGVKVVIENGSYGEMGTFLRPLSPGDRNSWVRAVQRKLRALSYYDGSLDGIYGSGLSAAVLKARKALGLPAVDRVDEAFYAAIGLMLFE